MNTDVNWVAEPPPTPTWVRLPLFRPRATPFLVGLLVLIHGAVILYGLQHGGGLTGQLPQDIAEQFGRQNAAIAAGEYGRLLTAMFLHFDLLHLALNSWGIYLFGALVERYFGTGRFVVIYLVAGLVGNIASFAFSPAYSVSVGASGALFGLVGALAVYFWLHRRLTGMEGRAQLLNAVFVVGLNLVFGLALSQVIDNWGHIGGLIGGAIAGLVLAPRYQPGRYIADDERLLADAVPPWATAGLTLALCGGTVLTFTLALLTKQ